MREPLPGWREVGSCLLIGNEVVGAIAYVSNHEIDGQWTGRVLLGEGGNRFFSDSLVDAMLAAEDAARAMVADMAKALGGSVTWAAATAAAAVNGGGE